MKAKKVLAMLLCLCMVVALAACGAAKPEEPKEVEYKLGMGVVVNMDSSATGNAQIDATVAAVVTGADGKIVSCRLDVAQNKMNVTDGAVDTAQSFKTKMELGDDYGMASSPYSPDNNGDGKVLEWYEQSAAFSKYVVGKTAVEVEDMKTKEVNGHQISADDALLSAGCTIQITSICAVMAQAANNAR